MAKTAFFLLLCDFEFILKITTLLFKKVLYYKVLYYIAGGKVFVGRCVNVNAKECESM